MIGKQFQLRYAWKLDERLDGGGFGQVWTASSPDVEVPAVAKLVPKAPGAQRELLFVDLGAARNVVPVLDSGETESEYVLVMERAEKSLRQHLNEHGRLSESETITVLGDIVVALQDLAGRVGRIVHRDLKPENVLLLNGIWCLCDFGISRYAEVTTAEDTRKYAMTPPYAAPEQWRFEQATNATDIYALGIMAHEMLSGARPFPGIDHRDEHLHRLPETLTNVCSPLASLITECLNKAPEARPSARDVASRLANVGDSPLAPGLAKLQQAHHQAVVARAEEQTRAARAESESDRRTRLSDGAQRGLELIANELQGALTTAAPSIAFRVGHDGSHLFTLGNASLSVSSACSVAANPLGVPFDVIAYGDLGIQGPGTHGYRGRSHSLWYCDAEDEGRFSWYELAFMHMALMGGSRGIVPFALSPSDGAPAIAPGVATVQLAWNMRRLIPGQLADFIERWAGWMATAAEGRLAHPTTLPEEQIVHNWRGS